MVRAVHGPGHWESAKVRPLPGQQLTVAALHLETHWWVHWRQVWSWQGGGGWRSSLISPGSQGTEVSEMGPAGHRHASPAQTAQAGGTDTLGHPRPTLKNSASAAYLPCLPPPPPAVSLGLHPLPVAAPTVLGTGTVLGMGETKTHRLPRKHSPGRRHKLGRGLRKEQRQRGRSSGGKSRLGGRGAKDPGPAAVWTYKGKPWRAPAAGRTRLVC